MSNCILCFQQTEKSQLQANDKLTDTLTIAEAIRFNFTFIEVQYQIID